MNQFNFTSANAQIAGQKGVANGIASLDSTGKVPNSQLPGATQSAAGTMSAADKTKLDGIATGATAVTIIDNLTTNDATKALSAKQGKALNDQIGTYSDNVTYTTLSAITSMLTTVASTLVVNQTKNIRIHTGTDTSLSPFTAWNDFSGYMTKYSATYWACFFVGIDGRDVEVGCNNGTITCRSLNTNISTKSVATGIPGVTAYKAGNVVMLSIVATSPASKGWFPIGTLPSELRPVMDFYTSIVLVNTDDTSAQMQITASTGYTKVYNPNATANSVNGAIMYLTANEN